LLEVLARKGVVGHGIERGLLVRKFTQPEDLAGRRHPDPDTLVAKPAGSARILVVDDHEDVRRMLATALELEGYDVDEAATAHEGLKQLRATRYQLVLTDYAMPGGTGTWMLREASRLGFMAHTVALVVTAHPDLQDLSDAPVIAKPLELDEFLEHVRTILGVPASVGPEAHLHAVGRAG
jgi:CheY-like chemotaxis protein